MEIVILLTPGLDNTRLFLACDVTFGIHSLLIFFSCLSDTAPKSTGKLMPRKGKTHRFEG